jgi:hypothetical protein
MPAIGLSSLCRRALMRWKRCGANTTQGQAKMLTSDFKEFAELLNLNQVEYLVVGGYALAVYGHPRYTGDLDFWVGRHPANAKKLLAVLNQFGFGTLGIQESDFTGANQVLQLGFPPGRIDLLTSIDGVAFDDCYARRLTLTIDGIELRFIAIDDFKANKLAVGRHQDLADLETLNRLQSP